MSNTEKNNAFAFIYDYKDKRTNIDNYIRYMMVRTLTMFKYHDLPDSIPQRELEYMLQVNGHCCIAEHEGVLYALSGTFAGEQDAYGRPKQYLVSNPYIKCNKTFTINDDCIIIRNDDMMVGLMPMLQKYCTLLNENDVTMLLADVNHRIQTLISANDDRTIDSARIYLKQIFDGEIGVISESQLFDTVKVNNTSTTPHLKELFEYHQYLKAGLFNEIGLNANYNMKRERLTKGEVEVNSEALYPFIDNMYECREQAINAINEHYGTDIAIEFNSSWDYRLNNGEPIDTALDKVNLPAEPTEPTESTESEKAIETEEQMEPEEQIEPTEQEEQTETNNEEKKDEKEGEE